MQEMLPVIRELWKGDYAHEGEHWSFPASTSCPKPLQKEVPVWVAARAPITYDYAVKHGCNIQSWPLTRDMGEAQAYMDRLNEAVANNPGSKRPTMAMMRHTALYDRKEDWMVPVRAAQRQLSQFENLFKNMGDVENGFPKSIPFDQLGNRAEYDPEMLSRNLMFGTPDEVIAKLKAYEAIGVDEFIYYASLGLGLKEQKRSLELFCKEVIPAFA
jgi:alkanesulfonate monooxygenase SsuD/methylene tetrahydromethanopterin reductase-like flavin-dependent oxidoreductase (luciferase family)